MIARLAAPPLIALLTLAGHGSHDLLFVEREAFLMGTRVRLAVWTDARGDGLARLDRGLRALEETEAELSTWRADSAISHLNQTPAGQRWTAPPSICDLLATLGRWHAATGGAFDPAIGNLAAVWDIHGAGRIPSEQDIARARRSTGLSHLDIGADCAVVRRADVTLDAGGFGKGEALDRARAVMGPHPWLIDLGGQVAAAGAPPGKAGWPVAVAHPAQRDRPAMDVTLAGGSLATSAGSERDHLVRGRRIGHILDPRTGLPAPFDGSVSVWHESALVADILSTALYVMGPDQGIPWAERHGIAACYLVAASGGAVRRVASRAFASSVLFLGHSRS